MQIKITKEFSLQFESARYRVWAGSEYLKSFDTEIEAKEFIARYKSSWITLKPEIIYTEEI